VKQAVTVNIAGQVPNTTLSFSCDSPSTSSILPTNGPTQGGSILTVAGPSFGKFVGNVLVGGNLCPAIQITCATPAGQGLSHPAIVTAANTSLVSNSLTFDYGAPSRPCLAYPFITH
jgi:hypothetical protein